jgi:SHS2 domain-containing protein
MNNFEVLEHPTDLKIKVNGCNLAELFKNAGLALFCSIDPKTPRPKSLDAWREVSVAASDVETLLVDWLSELLYLHDVNKTNYFDIEIIEMSPTSMLAKVRGIPSKQDKFEVKAATYHGLTVKTVDSGYEATVLFDI